MYVLKSKQVTSIRTPSSALFYEWRVKLWPSDIIITSSVQRNVCVAPFITIPWIQCHAIPLAPLYDHMMTWHMAHATCHGNCMWLGMSDFAVLPLYTMGGFMEGSNTKSNSKTINPIGWEYMFWTQWVYIHVQVHSRRIRSGVHVASFSFCQILAVSNQGNTLLTCETKLRTWVKSWVQQ